MTAPSPTSPVSDAHVTEPSREAVERALAAHRASLSKLHEERTKSSWWNAPDNAYEEAAYRAMASALRAAIDAAEGSLPGCEETQALSCVTDKQVTHSNFNTEEEKNESFYWKTVNPLEELVKSYQEKMHECEQIKYKRNYDNYNKEICAWFELELSLLTSNLKVKIEKLDLSGGWYLKRLERSDEWWYLYNPLHEKVGDVTFYTDMEAKEFAKKFETIRK